METRQRALKPRICDQSVCQKGCGVLLSGHSMDTAKKHSCVEPLRAVKRALEERGAGLEHASRMARLRWNRTEQSLVAQVATLQNEAQLAALTYQQRLQRYLLHISSIVEQITGYCKNQSDSSTAADMQSHTSDHSTLKQLQLPTQKHHRPPFTFHLLLKDRSKPYS
ncbi:E3 ubiquitin-protein ligase PDZRN3-B-like [Girardinichthys multiradiatus]|uniref:E3 ubiquitin-protein ligase PDZRN3-B-like n=1 Tax=Girardinichthys multiradiatus TaxID=208333 RepID=UPI001FAB4A35|nr:E3 ubiquitin-protein ligase PDZRN3-B-like [Girardinichthys multiradiatus]